jgi:hypothetical protein
MANPNPLTHKEVIEINNSVVREATDDESNGKAFAFVVSNIDGTSPLVLRAEGANVPSRPAPKPPHPPPGLLRLAASLPPGDLKLADE